MSDAGGGWSGETPVDPLEIKSAQDFAVALNQLRARAGLSIRNLARELESESGEAVPFHAWWLVQRQSPADVEAVDRPSAPAALMR
ncbi:hypothetical protein [Amycolatopsis sp. CA-128772]|uniref:hypothetical protein n=1 Tax=Amycolatopsis sp. CA-128772 TaxID=2073159 RepID=UPI0011AFF7D5|nr:hypothetical protein [Amycolatopsis sp. CA-128772]